jgi:hypothetical protein
MSKDIRAVLDNVSSIEVTSPVKGCRGIGPEPKLLKIRTINGPVIELLLNPASLAAIVLHIEPSCGIRLMDQDERI